MYPLEYKSEIIEIRTDIQSRPRYLVFKRNESKIPIFTSDSMAELLKWLIINHFLIRFGRK
jgi:hypothetical protein